MINWPEAITTWLTNLGLPGGVSFAIALIIGALILTLFTPTLALGLIWILRKVLGRIQDRIGPNRLGPYGLFQTIADAAKLMSKESITPTNADGVAYNLAPLLSVFGIVMLFGILPFSNGIVGVDLSVGVLYVVALGSIGVMAAMMAGWGSNNKYALLSGFRVVAQLLSYEIPLVLSMLTVVFLTNTMRMNQIAELQGDVFGLNLGLGWFGFIMPGAFLIFFICSLAESEQTPFDLLEAESELIAGFHIEYSGMRFAMFFLAQFLNSWGLAAIASVLFLGGWQGPFVDLPYIGPILGMIYFFIKAFALYTVQIWIKGTFPRLRVDQMMSFAWKVLVPITVALIVWMAIVLKLPIGTWLQYVLIFAGNVAIIGVIFNVLGRHIRGEEIRTKRSFDPPTLIGTMQVVSE